MVQKTEEESIPPLNAEATVTSLRKRNLQASKNKYLKCYTCFGYVSVVGVKFLVNSYHFSIFIASIVIVAQCPALS